MKAINHKPVICPKGTLALPGRGGGQICRHLVSVYSLGLVESYGQYSQKLAKANKMPKDLAKDVTKLSGLGNILVYKYLEIRAEILYQASKETVEKIVNKFIEWAKAIVEH